ncbi:MAG: flagellar basal body P-ring protein FlgI [Planctomycetes bacterium]|nr:flagellar basal body P-ring protein FlgI [Planctomycetota bacterium]
MKALPAITLAGILLLLADAAPAQIVTARVGDVTHLQGQGTNILIGTGLVTGLNGTGDGAKFLPTMQNLAAMMRRFGITIESLDDVKAAKNVAIVMVEVVVPENGVREGELLDVAITAFAAKSLEGGQLLSTPLIHNDSGVEGLFGFARGPISITEQAPSAGVIRDGARMERNVVMGVVVSGAELEADGFSSPWLRGNESYITLVLDDAHAGWSMAAAVAQAVDKELGISAGVDRVALALDSKNIAVLLPAHQRGDPASWIRDVKRTPLLMESNEARLTINRKTGTIVVTGDTRLSPVVVSQRGMTITVINPPADGTPVPQPTIAQHDFVALDNGKTRQPNVDDLLEALNRLRVPFADRVAILEEIHRAGKLHARIMYEG